jgi:antirestriction protein ArdC
VDHLRARPRSSASIINYEPAEHAIAATGADVGFGGNRAFYSRSHDFMQMPPKESFESQKEWYSTHLHELAHWSENRMEWKASYAMNELIAEIGSCYLTSEIGIPHSDDMTNHNSYLASWLKEFESDPKAIFKAATQASKVADFIMSFSRPKEEVANEDTEEAVLEVGGAA